MWYVRSIGGMRSRALTIDELRRELLERDLGQTLLRDNRTPRRWRTMSEAKRDYAELSDIIHAAEMAAAQRSVDDSPTTVPPTSAGRRHGRANSTTWWNRIGAWTVSAIACGLFGGLLGLGARALRPVDAPTRTSVEGVRTSPDSDRTRGDRRSSVPGVTVVEEPGFRLTIYRYTPGGLAGAAMLFGAFGAFLGIYVLLSFWLTNRMLPRTLAREPEDWRWECYVGGLLGGMAMLSAMWMAAMLEF